MRINKTSILSSIKLGENKVVPKDLQFLRTGSFKHPVYGNFEITPQVLSEMKANFDANIRGIDMALDYFHESDKVAAAWVTSLELRENGTELWGNVEWTPSAEQKLSERELRYFSPDFAFQWTDAETGNEFQNVLFGGGLTNRPFVKEMKAIVANEPKGVNDMTELEKAQAKVKEQEAQIKLLSEQKTEAETKLAAVPPPPAKPAVPAEDGPDVVAALKAQITQLQSQLAKAQSDADVALAEKKKADAATMLAEKTTQFNVLLTEGKACAAQKESFLKGDMTEFIKLAQLLNLKPSGTSDSPIVGEVDANEIIKLAEAKQKENPKLSRGDAISIAKKELKK